MNKIRVKYKMLSPISHIGDVESVYSSFQMVLTNNGRVPVITGNSVRGQLRDCMSIYMLDRIGCKVKKETFNIFFSGGNLNGSIKETVEKAKAVREHFPALSLLGSGLGDMMLSGKLICSFAYPVCFETKDITGEIGDKSWRNLIDEISFTRSDDTKNDQKSDYIVDLKEGTAAKTNTQMRFDVQYLAAGTEFVQDFMFLDSTTDLEMGAFYSGMKKWFEFPKLGGMVSKGFGKFDAEVGDGIMSVSKGEIYISEPVRELIEKYNEFLDNEGSRYISILETKKGKRDGKNKDTIETA